MCCSEHANLLKETLEKQFEVVKERVSRNGTYVQGSHVLQFGSLAIDEEPASDYLGNENTGKPEGTTCCCHTWVSTCCVGNCQPQLLIGTIEHLQLSSISCMRNVLPCHN